MPPPIGAPGDINSGARALPNQKTFHYTGKMQSFKVPAGVTKITVVARGGAGAGETSSSYSYREYFGRGGRVYAVLPVRPREILYVFVGGQGSLSAGGFNGGGSPGIDASGREGYGGGGASDVRRRGNTLRDRVLVAAGGGAQSCCGFSLFGGKGGPQVGEAGESDYSYGVGGGEGGTQSQGGAGGAGGIGSGSGSQDGTPGGSGTSGRGGSGGNGAIDGYCNRSNYQCAGGGGGGGGGGYYGGGGGGGGEGDAYYGAPGGGGGGGSSYVESRATRVQMWRGWKKATGNGLVVFSW
jgi:hypothetical protein